MTWPTHCTHGLSVNGPWCAKCRAAGLGLIDQEVADVAWAILSALHEDVPVDKRPMSWSDVDGDQEQRIRSAAVAAIECFRNRERSVTGAFAQPLEANTQDMSDLLDKFRDFAKDGSETDTIVVSRQEARDIVQEIDHLRSVSGAVSRGESFTGIRRRASPKTEPV